MANKKIEVKEDHYADGKLESRAVYVNGQPHGLYETWHENGQQECKHNYVDGKKHGLCEEWYENGQQSYKINYASGKRHGPYEGWNENGTQNHKDNYVDGKLHGLSDWTGNTAVVATIKYFVFGIEVSKSQFAVRNAAIVVAISEAIGSSEKALGVLVDGYATV